MEKLLGVNITNLKKIIVVEQDDKTELIDSILVNNDLVSYQIYTNHTGIYVNTVYNTQDIVVDGEYDVSAILYETILNVENFNIDSIELFWDEYKTYLLGFILKSNSKGLYFINLGDELILESEEDFFAKLKNATNFQTEKI
ncbi:hypothetical protein E6C50_03620 [Flavobacterium supellecticarium]|uniref:Uncharacterized protein n=1 Tax=Flavobacterium supellecticarium TaxID=2565924 RepID=A0A4S4A4B4_9FLAO|nr:hypothetical protein [Flavobacterium supellecticarium]THF53301.1 hypothetical protein E6C50_03620 [Flavobacterium supellecticarium]